MANKSFSHLAISGNQKKEVDEIKKLLESVGISDPTYEEVMQVLLEKNRNFILPTNKIKDIIKKSRGII